MDDQSESTLVVSRIATYIFIQISLIQVLTEIAGCLHSYQLFTFLC